MRTITINDNGNVTYVIEQEPGIAGKREADAHVQRLARFGGSIKRVKAMGSAYRALESALVAILDLPSSPESEPVYEGEADRLAQIAAVEKGIETLQADRNRQLAAGCVDAAEERSVQLERMQGLLKLLREPRDKEAREIAAGMRGLAKRLRAGAQPCLPDTVADALDNHAALLEHHLGIRAEVANDCDSTGMGCRCQKARP